MRPALPIALATLLAACSPSEYDSERCSAGGPAVQHLTEDAEACIAKWGQALSKSPDAARDVAEAVLAECSSMIPNDDETDDEGNTTGAASKAQWAEARRLAVFRVVEERAGHCSLKK